MRPTTNPNRAVTPRHGYPPNNQSNTPTSAQRQQHHQQPVNQPNNQPYNQPNHQYPSPNNARYNQSYNQQQYQPVNQPQYQHHQSYNQPNNQSISRSNPSASPPARPVPTPRSYQPNRQINNQSPNRFDPPSPSTSDSTEYDQSNNQHYDQSYDQDDYSPKKKPISAYTVPILSLMFVGILLFVIQSVYQSVNLSIDESANHSLNTEPIHQLIPLRPSWPSQHVMSGLSVIDRSPPVVRLNDLLAGLDEVSKKLPFCPPDILVIGDSTSERNIREDRKIYPKKIIDSAIDQLIDQKAGGSIDRLKAMSDDEIDALIDRMIDDMFDPDDVWPPISLDQSMDQSADQSVKRLNVYYQPDVTPFEMRKIAVPGTDVTIVRLIDQTINSANNQTIVVPSPSTTQATIKVLPGVKLDKSQLTPNDVIDALSEEEKNALRSKFRDKSLNRNLASRVYWKPEIHTLTLDKEYPPTQRTPTQYLFGDEFLFIVLTEKKNHGLVRKSLTAWGQYVKHVQVYSDFFDRKLNTTVLNNPLPQGVPRDLKNKPWRIPAFINHLASNPHLHTQFYMVIDEYSFPLLDQLRWRFDVWMKIWSNTLPSMIGGRPDKKPAKLSYWPQHQDAVNKLFSEPLQVIPKYAYGFDHGTLMQLNYYTPVDVCPVLSDDMLTLSGLMACAGGITVEKHFLAMTRSSHREKGIVGEQVESWRALDIYSGERTAGMVEEAFNWYYGGLSKLGPVESRGKNKTKSAFADMKVPVPATAIPVSPATPAATPDVPAAAETTPAETPAEAKTDAPAE